MTTHQHLIRFLKSKLKKEQTKQSKSRTIALALFDAFMHDKPLSLELLLPKALTKKPVKLPTALTTPDTDPDGLFYLIPSFKDCTPSSNTQGWSSALFGLTTISRPSWYPRAHALHLCASACLEGKRLGCRKWENELKGGAIRTKWTDLESWMLEHNPSTRFCFWGGNQILHAMTFYEAESPNLRNHKGKNHTMRKQYLTSLLKSGSWHFEVSQRCKLLLLLLHHDTTRNPCCVKRNTYFLRHKELPKPIQISSCLMPGGPQTFLRKKIKQEFILHISFSHLQVLYSFLMFIYTILYAPTPVLCLFPWAHSDPYSPSFPHREKRDCLAPG